MASSGYKKSIKPELVAIYRLEFYKNKKKWKFCNEKTREKAVPACGSLDTERNLGLDKTYSVDQHSDVEPTDKEKTSPLNNGFIHEIPYDTPIPEVAEPPPPPPTPQSTEGLWPEELSEHGSQPFQKDMWMKHEVNNQQLINNTQPQQWTNHHTQSHEAWTNQGQPIDIQWLMETSGNHPEGYQPQTTGPPIQDEWAGRQQPSLQKTQGNQVPIINDPEIQPTWPNNATPNQFYPALWTNTSPPTGQLQNKGPLPSLSKIQGQSAWDQMSGPVPQGPPANNLSKIQGQSAWDQMSGPVPQGPPANNLSKIQGQSTWDQMSGPVPQGPPANNLSKIQGQSAWDQMSGPVPQGPPANNLSKIQGQSTWDQMSGPVPQGPPANNLSKIQGQSTWDQMSGPVPQGPPANNLQMLLCPEKWKKQPITAQKSLDPPKINPDDWTKPPPGYKPDAPDIWAIQPDNPKIIHPDFVTKPPPVTPTQLRKNADGWTNQHNNPQKINPDTLNNQTPNSWTFTRPPPLENPQKSAQSANIKSSPTSAKPSPEVWPNNQKGPAKWTNPALLLNVEQENTWTNQAWQKQQDVLQNKDQDWMVTVDEDVHDGVTGEDGGTADLQPQFGNDECTRKPQPSPEPYEPQTAELVRESADRWLRRLLQVYRADLDATEQYQGDETSVEFIREAHGVPHSSENDPSEVDECICSYMPVESLAGMSPARLAAVIQHATRTLRDVLKEQLIRDRLKNRRVISLEEYPTRDTDLFGCEYVLSGSHVPRSTGALATGTDRVIKIDMGRPYRL